MEVFLIKLIITTVNCSTKKKSYIFSYHNYNINSSQFISPTLQTCSFKLTLLKSVGDVACYRVSPTTTASLSRVTPQLRNKKHNVLAALCDAIPAILANYPYQKPI